MKEKGNYNPLTPKEAEVILYKGTEAPYTGEYENFRGDGTYVCRQCEAPLYRSESKFHSGCGWPSFDQEIEGAVKHVPDADGRRTEILCEHCGGHLGHVFLGEGFTEKDTRHCVNSISLKFVPKADNLRKLEKVYLAGGCFWGMEELIRAQTGVMETEVGYTGGKNKNPTYEFHPGHAEAVEISYDPEKISYRQLLDFFFRVHDPSTLNRQGNDRGSSYRSAIFYQNEEEKKEAEAFITLVNESKRWPDPVATSLEPFEKFWPAELYHQDYLVKNPGGYTCHFVRFGSYL